MTQKADICIKRAKLSDLERIFQIEQSIFSPFWSKEILKNEMERENSFFLIACEDDVVCGYAVMDHVLDEGSLLKIATAIDKREKGIATFLLNELIKIANDEKLSFITLEVRESNKKALSIYEKAGFKKAGVRKNYYKTPLENALILTKELR